MKFPVLRAFESRNFRLYTLGQSFSLVGTWMQQLAISWLVYRLTGSSALLGAAVFAAQIPMLFLSPVAGVWVDRLDRRRVALLTQTLLMLQAAALAALSLSGLIQIWHVMVLNVFFGVVNSLDMPTRQSLVPDLVERREDLGNAIALNASLVNVTRLVGPALGGILIMAVGEAVCFAINAASFSTVILSLALLRVPRVPRPATPEKPVLRGFKDGLRYAFGFEPIGTLLALLAITSLMGMPYTVLMPVFATRVLLGDARTLGFLSAASGLGALMGAIYLASRGTVRGLLRRIAASTAFFGVGLLIFSTSRNFWLSEAALFFSGFGVMVLMAASNTVLQTLADDDKRGRVMSLYVTALMGISPIGGLLAGTVASRLGASLTVAIGGATCALAALVFAFRIPALRLKIRPIYREKGISPAPAVGPAAPPV